MTPLAGIQLSAFNGSFPEPSTLPRQPEALLRSG